MTSENVAFYARLKDVQVLQHKREQKRMDLQRKFDNSVTSDHRLSRLRAARLQSYWKKVCEDERKSKARNEQLLRDFERVEAHIATLSSRTQRLKLLKDQYEQQVEAMYPYWKEKMEIKRQSQINPMQQPANVPLSVTSTYEQYSGQVPNQVDVPKGFVQNGTNGTFSGTSAQQSIPSSYMHVHHQNRPGSHSQPNTNHRQFPQSHAPSVALYRQPAPSTLPHSQPQYPPNVLMYGQEVTLVPGGHAQAPHGQHRTTSGERLEEQYSQLPPGGAGRVPANHGAHNTPAAYGQTEDSTTFSISSETPSSPFHQAKPGGNAPVAVQDMHAAQPRFQTESHEAGSARPSKSYDHAEKSGKEINSSGRQARLPASVRSNDPSSDQALQKNMASAPSVGTVDKPPSAQTEPFSSSDDDSEDHIGGRADNELYSPELPPALPTYEEGEASRKGSNLGPVDIESDYVQPMRIGVHVQPSESQESSGSEEDSEIDSDVSLPLSDNDARSTNAKPVPAERSSVESKPSMPQAAAPNPIALSLNGFWLLLKAVEAEIDETDSLEGIYASLPCTRTIRDEIVRTANVKSGFDRLDPRAISMVILEELPLLVRQLPAGCLLSEKLLLASSRTITEISIRSHMYSSALNFWDDILHHMVFLVRRGVMEPEAVARKFAPHLVAADSKAVDKAINVMSDILLKAEEEEEVTLGDESSLTATSPMSPDNPAASPDVPRRAKPGGPGDYPSVPPLALGGMEGDTDDLLDTGRTSADSFFDSKVPLTETTAYQRMMMSTQPEKGRESKEADGIDDSGDDDEDDDSESEDEIEKATRVQPDSPTSQQIRKKRNVLSSLGGSLGMSLGGVDDAREEDGVRDSRPPLPSDRTDEVSSPEKSDLASSLSPTPRGGGGYVPSVMEQSMKSTGRTDTMNRSAAFWGNESDLDDESEMSVPMGTGKVEEEKDDFDFYD